MSNLPNNFRQQAYSLMDLEIDETVREMASFCESPIEVAFATAFMILGNRYYTGVAFCEPGYTKDLFPVDFEFVLAAQRQIGKYRVDFVASWNPISSRQNIVVECDGHSFHERTKEQAARDRARDRELQSAGYRVFRFTGSEIYRDAFKCATEVFEALLVIGDEAGNAG